MQHDLDGLLNFFSALAALSALGLAIWFGAQRDERRWKRERDADQAHTAPE